VYYWLLVIKIFNRRFTRTLDEICRKLVLFLFFILSLTIILGILMHFIEGETGGFASISLSICRAITTLLTVGYGDTVPQTDIGRLVACKLLYKVFFGKNREFD
jgi:voltage-gated potassium channel Kch